MPLLISSDLHLTDNSIDDYRWGFFAWLRQTILEHNITLLILAGDLCDQKDKHSAIIVNRVVDHLIDLSKSPSIQKIIILRGNHDYLVDPTLPYFRFLNGIHRLSFIIEPTRINLDDKRILFLPNSRTPHKDWSTIDLSNLDLIICHQTFTGAIAENGATLSGIDQHIFDHTNASIISGDIHVPQQLGRVTYVGSPYHIHFNDKFIPRVLLLINNELRDLHFNTIKRHTLHINTIADLKQFTLNPEDQVKIRIKLDSVLDLTEIKKNIIDFCAERKIYLYKTEFYHSDQDIDTSIKQQEARLLNSSVEEIFDIYCGQYHIAEDLKIYGKTVILQEKEQDAKTIK